MMNSSDFSALNRDSLQSITRFLDLNSLCFFAVSNKRALQASGPALDIAQKELLNFNSFNDFNLILSSIPSSNNFVECWLDSKKSAPIFTKITKLPGRILHIAERHSTIIVLTEEGMYVYGNNRHGQLGLGHNQFCNSFTKVDYLQGKILQFDIGYNHVIVHTNEATYTSGYNYYGQLCSGNHNTTYTFSQIKSPPGKVIQVAAGHSHSAILTDEGLYMCGDNFYGQLGLGHNNYSPHLTRITTLPGKILRILTGDYHTLAYTDLGYYGCGHSKSPHFDSNIFSSLTIHPSFKKLISLYKHIDQLKQFEMQLEEQVLSNTV